MDESVDQLVKLALSISEEESKLNDILKSQRSYVMNYKTGNPIKLYLFDIKWFLLNFIGEFYYNNGDYVLAFKYLKKASDHNSTDFNCQLRLGMVATTVGHLKAAKQAFIGALVREPKNQNVIESIFLVSLVMKDIADFKTFVDHIVLYNITSPLIYFLINKIYAINDDWELPFQLHVPVTSEKEEIFDRLISLTRDSWQNPHIFKQECLFLLQKKPKSWVAIFNAVISIISQETDPESIYCINYSDGSKQSQISSKMDVSQSEFDSSFRSRKSSLPSLMRQSSFKTQVSSTIKSGFISSIIDLLASDYKLQICDMVAQFDSENYPTSSQIGLHDVNDFLNQMNLNPSSICDLSMSLLLYFADKWNFSWHNSLPNLWIELFEFWFRQASLPTLQSEENFKILLTYLEFKQNAGVEVNYDKGTITGDVLNLLGPEYSNRLTTICGLSDGGLLHIRIFLAMTLSEDPSGDKTWGPVIELMEKYGLETMIRPNIQENKTISIVVLLSRKISHTWPVCEKLVPFEFIKSYLSDNLQSFVYLALENNEIALDSLSVYLKSIDKDMSVQLIANLLRVFVDLRFKPTLECSYPFFDLIFKHLELCLGNNPINLDNAVGFIGYLLIFLSLQTKSSQPLWIKHKIVYPIVLIMETIYSWDSLDSFKPVLHDNLPILSLQRIIHAELLKHSSCMISGGYIMKQFLAIHHRIVGWGIPKWTELCTNDSLQIVHCMYGLIEPKKCKSVKDHATKNIPFDIVDTKHVYGIFISSPLPQIYSSKAVGRDILPVLTKMARFVIQESILENNVRLILDGRFDQLGEVRLSDDQMRMRDIYYMVALMLFKDKNVDSQAWALDLAINPFRFDSAVGLAVTEATKIKPLINSVVFSVYQLNSDYDDFSFEEIERIRRYFGRVCSMADSSRSIWNEYALLEYKIHGYLKHINSINLPFFEKCGRNGEEECQRALSFSCEYFQKSIEDYSVNEKNDGDRWLPCYFLAKIYEKSTNAPITKILDLYAQAADAVHFAGAHYPAKVLYIQKSGFLTSEALEIYYRQNVAVLKQLGKIYDHIDEIEDYFIRLQNSNFVQRRELNRGNVKAKGSADESNWNMDSNHSACSNFEGVSFKENNIGEIRTFEDKLDRIVLLCLNGLVMCSKRQQYHYKVIYRLAYFYYCRETCYMNVSLARQIMLGPIVPSDSDFLPVQALFSKHTKDNLFANVWMIHAEDVERGKFHIYLYKAVKLLLNILVDLSNLEELSTVFMRLSRVPDDTKKYLNDFDRLELVRLAESYYFQLLHKVINQRKDLDFRKVLTDTVKLWPLNGNAYVTEMKLNAILKLGSLIANKELKSLKELKRIFYSIDFTLIYNSILFADTSDHTLTAASDKHMELLSVTINIISTPYTILNIYIPPLSCCQKGYHRPNLEFLQLYENIVICGDLNAKDPQ